VKEKLKLTIIATCTTRLYESERSIYKGIHNVIYYV
jgi:hypothetical protein